ncbi:unnamed protein product, partial [Staurois parvus]
LASGVYRRRTPSYSGGRKFNVGSDFICSGHSLAMWPYCRQAQQRGPLLMCPPQLSYPEWSCARC